MYSVSPDGRYGCCSDDAPSASKLTLSDVDCSGIDDSMYVYLLVYDPNAECTTYTLSYHF